MEYYKLVLNNKIWVYDQKHMGYIRKMVIGNIVLMISNKLIYRGNNYE